MPPARGWSDCWAVPFYGPGFFADGAEQHLHNVHRMTDLAALPDHLLGPLLESAATTLRALPLDEVPGVLRPLLGFDRRGMNRGPARLQLRRALDAEVNFRERVFADFCERAEVSAVLTDWRPEDALAVANAWALRLDLPLLASVLVAAEPEGAGFGLGAIVAVDAAQRRAHEDEAEAVELTALTGALEEGLRRAEAARAALEEERDALAEQLRSERRARREREERGSTDVARAELRVAELEAELVGERARVERAETARAHSDQRFAAAEAALQDARRAAAAPRPADATDAAEAGVIAAAARTARGLAESLESLTNTRDARAGRVGAAAVSRASGRRARPSLPGGLVADTAKGAGAMLRAPSVLLVVDGYNVSKTGWPNASLEVERESLLNALHGLHLTRGTDVIVAFDGDGTQSFGSVRRTGVRVVFSEPGIEADSVVVEVVAKTPLAIPVVVASSDRWVREHAETFGAVVISSATLVAVLRSGPGRPDA
jgi:predicted RNA-binding protein with PIN domain